MIALLLACASALSAPLQDAPRLSAALVVDHPGFESGDMAAVREDLLTGLEREPSSPYAAAALATVSGLDGFCAEPLPPGRLGALLGRVREPLASLRLRQLVQAEEGRLRFSDVSSARTGDLWADYLREWRLVGPLGRLDAPVPLRLPLEDGPEASVRATYTAQWGESLAWRPLPRQSESLFVRPGAQLLYTGGGLGYVATWVRTEARDLTLEVLSPGELQAFWNGRLVIDEPTRGLGEGEDRFLAPVTAHDGWNALVVRFRNTADVAVAARLLGRAGEAMRVEELDLRASDLPELAPSPAAAPLPEPARPTGADALVAMVDAIARGRSDLALAEPRPAEPELLRPYLRLRMSALQGASHLPDEVQRRAWIEVEDELERTGGHLPEVLVSRAVRSVREDKPAEGLALAEAALEKMPLAPRVHRVRLSALNALDDEGELEREALLDLCDRLPARAEGPLGLGLACQRAGDLAGAVQYLRRALTLDGDGATLRAAAPVLARAGGEHRAWLTEHLAAWRAAVPGDERPAAMLLQVAAITGDDAAQEALLREDVEERPARVDPVLALADFLLSRGRADEARPLYQDALVRWPGSHTARGTVALFGLEDPAERFFTAFAPDREAAWERRASPALQPAADDPGRDSSVAELLDSGLVYLYPDGSSRQRMHSMSLALNRKGTELLHEQPVAEHVRAARVLKRDGTVLEPAEVAGSWVMPDLDIGDAVEMVWEDFRGAVPGSAPDLGWWRFASFEKPFLCSRYAIFVPDGLEGELRAAHFDGRHEEQAFEGGTVHVFTVLDRERQPEEPLAPSYEELLPWLQYGADGDLRDAQAAWRERLDAFQHCPADIGQELDRFLADLPSGLDARALAREIHARVTERVLDFEGAPLAAQVWSARRGEPTFLLGELYRRAGIPHTWCLLETGVAPELDPNPVRAFQDTSPYPGVVLRLDLDPPVHLLGGTARGAAFGVLPPELAGARTMELSDDGFTLSELPRAQLDEEWDNDLSLTFTLTADGAALVTGNWRVTTARGAVMREQISQMGDVQRRAVARQVVGQLALGIDLSSYEFPGLKDRGGAFALTFEGRIPGFVTARGGDQVADLRLPPTGASTGLGPAKRTWPLALRFSRRERVRARLEPGESWRVLAGPAAFDAQQPGFEHVLEVTPSPAGDGGAWEWRRRFLIRGLELEASEVPEFLQRAAEREREESRAVRLERR